MSLNTHIQFSFAGTFHYSLLIYFFLVRLETPTAVFLCLRQYSYKACNFFFLAGNIRVFCCCCWAFGCCLFSMPQYDKSFSISKHATSKRCNAYTYWRWQQPPESSNVHSKKVIFHFLDGAQYVFTLSYE